MIKYKSGEFTEDLHPRDNAGKFSESSGKGGGKLEPKKQTSKYQEEIDRAWANVGKEETNNQTTDKNSIRQKIADDLYADQKGKIKMPNMKELASKPFKNAEKIETAIQTSIPEVQTDRWVQPTLGEIYDAAKSKLPSLSADDFKTAIAKMHIEGRIRALTHTRSVDDIEQPEYSILADGEVFNRAELRK